ncbi:recombinase XerD [Caproiciproducens sp. NJN-50]|uniref:tyrosine-type recombinase/integrase n=1 Tax=Acutalibacteraceae TaxID=3082771 RepID=UPI000FFDFA0C|nr:MULTISPECIES: tyrosine-type recombinase/integrase [Acutalibacteraceae]QAT49591.1 recombinase XerD [Caproiciproducens sp. NJN-50]
MTVEPIRDKQKINSMFFYLKGKDPKYGLLFKFGLNTGLRISDIIPLKLSDILKNDHEFHDYLVVKEKKTQKEKKIKLNDALKKEVICYLKSRENTVSSYLFYSNKGGHISRIQAYRVLKEAADFCGIENFGTHSLRKTWGYWTYKKSKYNIGLIMSTFNHSSQRITLRYIGITQDQQDELYLLVQL